MTFPLYPLARLVSSPDIDAEVRFDFHDPDLSWSDPLEWSLGTPPLLGDPGGVGAEYGLRTITFNMYLQTSGRRVMSLQSTLARELLRDDNYLMFQLSESTPPLWFHTYRATPGQMAVRPFNEAVWSLEVSLVADPFALGEQVTLDNGDGAGIIAIPNDPEAPGGLAVQLPEIVGDAPAPLVVEVNAGSSAYIQPLFHIMPLNRPWPGLQFWQADSDDFERDPNDCVIRTRADASGGTVVDVDPSVLSETLRRMTAFVAPTLAGVYRVFARIGISDPGELTVFGAGPAALSTVRTVINYSGRDLWSLVELGTYAFPRGNMPVTRPYQVGTGQVGINSAEATSRNPGSFSVDYFVAVPVELPLDQAAPGILCEFTSGSATNGNVVLRINGEREVVEEIDAGVHQPGDLRYPRDVPRGGFLVGYPGATNVLTVLPRRQFERETPDDTITTVTTLRITYRPLWLYLASS